MLAILTPTLFLNEGAGSWISWAFTAVAGLGACLFVVRERSARHPLLDLELVRLPHVSSGLAFKTASGLAVAGLGSDDHPPAATGVGMAGEAALVGLGFRRARGVQDRPADLAVLEAVAE